MAGVPGALGGERGDCPRAVEAPEAQLVSRRAPLTAVRLRRRPPRVKVHGLLRTGTNYLAALLARNFHVEVLDVDQGGWKHGPLHLVPGGSFVVIFKNPYTWIDSFYEWERIHHRTAAPSVLDFAREPVTHPRLVEAWAPRDPIDAWNRTSESWLAAADQGGVMIVRYEDLIENVILEMDRFSAFCPARRRRRRAIDIVGRVDTWPTPMARRSLDRDRYRTGAASSLDPAVLRLLDESLDPRLVRRLGYARPG